MISASAPAAPKLYGIVVEERNEVLPLQGFKPRVRPGQRRVVRYVDESRRIACQLRLRLNLTETARGSAKAKAWR